MANLNTLRPFKKGQSGNPKGRPPTPDLREAIAKALSNGELLCIISDLVAKAKKGDTRAAQIILDRAYGSAKQFIEQQGGENPIRIEVIYNDSVSQTP